MEELVEPTRAQPGCHRYTLYQGKEQPDVWLLFEEWRSEDNLKAHVETPHMKAFLERSKEVILEGPNSYRSHVVSDGSKQKR